MRAWWSLVLVACGATTTPPDAATPSLKVTAPDEPGLPVQPEQVAPPPPPTSCPPDTALETRWPGEYPSPVVQVDAPTQVQARAIVCAVAEQPCTIPPGLYHPWAKDTKARFASLHHTARYEVLQDVLVMSEIGELTVAAGTEITQMAYLAEGQCHLFVNGAEVQGECPSNPGAEARYKRRSATPPSKAEQWLGVPCAEGHEAWVRVDDALGELPTVQWGQIKGPGEVGPAAP